MKSVYIYGKDEKSFSVKKALEQSKIKVKGCIDDLSKIKKFSIFFKIQKVGLIVCGNHPEINQELLHGGGGGTYLFCRML